MLVLLFRNSYDSDRELRQVTARPVIDKKTMTIVFNEYDMKCKTIDDNLNVK
jgi:hypothetical protein